LTGQPGTGDAAAPTTRPPGWSCPQCATNNAEGAKFCGECGSPMPVAEATSAAAPSADTTELADGQPHTFAAPPTAAVPGAVPGGLVQRLRKKPALIVAAVVVLALAVFGIAKLTGPSKHTLHGTLTLEGSYGFNPSSIGCSGTGGFDDLHMGTDVTVTDGAGKTIGVGNLRPGTAASGNGSCVFSFDIDDVPAADFYQVTAGNSKRGGPHYTSKDMDANNWTVALVIGG
jgi:hypothetical protein